MKRLLLLLSCCFTTFFLQAQKDDAGVEYVMFGVQTGFVGGWFYAEAGLTPTLAFRGEVGVDGGYLGGTLSEDGHTYSSVLSVEPRWYYNLINRDKKGKNTKKNTADFVTLKVSYHTSIVSFSDLYSSKIPNDVSFIPMWGLRRHIGNHLNYEAGLGVGCQYTVYKKLLDGSQPNNKWDAVGYLHLRFGYSF